MRIPRFGALVLLLLLAFADIGPAAPLYWIQDLGVVPGTSYSAGRAINNRGQVVGDLEAPGDLNVPFPDDVEFPFLWTRGRMISLGLPPGNYTDAYATDINDRGDVVGIAEGDHDYYTGFWYRDGRMHTLSNVLQFPIVFRRLSINDRGDLAGTGRITDNGRAFAFVYRKGVRTILPSPAPGGSSIAMDINNSGQIVGAAHTVTPNENHAEIYHAVIYSRGRIIDLGTLPGGATSFGLAINAFGHAVGYSETHYPPPSTHAFAYRHGIMRDLGVLPGDAESQALGINNAGEIVGNSISSLGRFRAVIFTHGRVHDLNTLLANSTSLVLEQATAINDHGLITGIGRLGPTCHAFVLTPVRRTR